MSVTDAETRPSGALAAAGPAAATSGPPSLMLVAVPMVCHACPSASMATQYVELMHDSLQAFFHTEASPIGRGSPHEVPSKLTVSLLVVAEQNVRDGHETSPTPPCRPASRQERPSKILAPSPAATHQSMSPHETEYMPTPKRGCAWIVVGGRPPPL